MKTLRGDICALLQAPAFGADTSGIIVATNPSIRARRWIHAYTYPEPTALSASRTHPDKAPYDPAFDEFIVPIDAMRRRFRRIRRFSNS